METGNGDTEPEKRVSIISSLIRSVSGCVMRNSVLNKLALEGLPLTVDYVQLISSVNSQGTIFKIYFKTTVNSLGHLPKPFT